MQPLGGGKHPQHPQRIVKRLPFRLGTGITSAQIVHLLTNRPFRFVDSLP
jgi:hypothetical protein